MVSVVLSHLSSSSPPSRKVLVIDVSGNFSVQVLSSIIKSRILSASKTSGQKVGHGYDPDELEDNVVKCLQMIDIDTVFNITGLWEVLGSIGGSAKENETEMVFIDNSGVLINSLLASSRSEGILISSLTIVANMDISQHTIF